jgi:hypothetical protein
MRLRVRRWRLVGIAFGIVSMLASILVLVGPGGTATAFPPVSCIREGQSYIEGPTTGGNYLVWVCQKGPYFGYWWKLDRIGNINDEAKAISETGWKKFIQGEVWQGLVQAGLGGGQLSTTLVGSFDLRALDGQPYTRTMAVRVAYKYLPSGGSSWIACGDSTKFSSYPTSTLSYHYTHAAGRCGTGYYQTWVTASFVSAATGKWVNTDWMHTPSLFIRSVGT